jgi:uncharacterized protein YqfB (UPF0267 family)
MLDNTIAAIATAPGEAGIGIVRVSGDKSIDILKKVFKPKRDIDIEDIPSRMMVYGYAVDSNGETLDEVLAVIMRKPYSYTMEDVVELHCHGGIYMGIKIVTDSICDVPKNYADRYGIRVMPLTVHFGNISYVDGIDLTLEEFLEKLEKAEALPTTSQVTPGDFFEAYKEEIAAGNKVISIHASSHLSGTYNSAVIAKEQMAGADIHVIDTMGISLGAGLLAIKAVRLAEEGMEAEDIVKQIEVSKQKMKYILVLDTLKYLQKGGRISLSAAQSYFFSV